MKNNYKFVTVGNPNAGKSTLFNGLTGADQTVGNWSGVTVSQKSKSFTLLDKQVELVDLPGVYDLTPSSDTPLDEQVTQQYLSQHNDIDLIINVVDATALERHLYLTIQLLEFGLPVLIVFNKLDAAEKLGIQIDIDAISHEFGCKAVGINAKAHDGYSAFKQAIFETININEAATSPVVYPPAIQQQLEAGSASIYQKLEHIVATHQTQLDVTTELAQSRYAKVDEISQKFVHKSVKHRLSEKLDFFCLHPIMGPFIFLLMMYLMFMFSINVGSAFIDFFDILAGAIFIDGASELYHAIGLPDWLSSILANGIGSGIQTVSTFIPVIAALYIALSILESSGYLARAAFVIDGVMKKIGLPGKAFVPMIVGFGCSVPAILATRTLGAERERIITGMMVPFMSCGARLPVYALFAAAFFPQTGQNLVFVLYLIGIGAAIGTGLLLKHTILPGQSSSMVMELPAFELPEFKDVLKRTFNRTKNFVTGAGQTIIVVVALLNVANSIGMDGSFGNDNSENSILSEASKVITPMFTPMGIGDDNWQATVGIITGIFAKEAVVGTLNSLYNQGEEEGSATFSESWDEAIASIGDNLLGIAPSDPLSLDVGHIEDQQLAAEEQAVSLTTFSALQAGFTSLSSAFAFLLFVLLYTPCAAAMGALVGEFGKKWALFAGAWTFYLGYAGATLYYQTVNFAAAPLFASACIALIIASFTAFVLWLKKRGNVLANRIDINVVS